MLFIDNIYGSIDVRNKGNNQFENELKIDIDRLMKQTCRYKHMFTSLKDIEILNLKEPSKIINKQSTSRKRSKLKQQLKKTNNKLVELLSKQKSKGCDFCAVYSHTYHNKLSSKSKYQ